MDWLGQFTLYRKWYYVCGCAVTRGDGHVGEDVTANVRTIKSIPS